MSLRESLRGAPGLESAALASFVVFNDGYVMSTVRKPDDPKVTNMRQLTVSPDYWETLRIPLGAGRAFTARDDERAPHVAVLSESLATKLYPDQSALGQHVRIGRADEAEIVGVVKDTKFTSVAAPARDIVYLPLLQGESYSRGVVL